MEKTKREVTESQLDIGLLLITICLVCFGMLMIYSTSSYTSQVKYGDSMYFLKKQAFGVTVGLVAMFIVAKFDYRLFMRRLPVIHIRLVTLLYFIALTLQVTVLVVGDTINGAKRWLSIGPLSLQPSEISKIAVILMVAFLIQKNPYVMSKFNGAFRVGAVVGVLLFTIVIENLSTGIVIAIITLGMCFIAARRRKMYVIMIIIGMAAVGLLLVFGGGFRTERLSAWFNVETNKNAYQTLQGLYAIASGGLFGTGLGESMQKLGFIPESHNDMIFSIICEELGMVGAGIVIFMFILLLWRIFRVATSSPDLFSGMICTGVMIHIAAQVGINIAVVTNSIPSTGIPLPFISYGGTSISILLAEMGLVLGISSKRKSG